MSGNTTLLEKRKITKVEDFIVYQKAMGLFDQFIEHDVPTLSRDSIGKELARQLVRSLDSICANLEEGYGRKSGDEFKHFVRMSRGSARESKGRYLRCKHFLPSEVVEERVGDLDTISAMLHSLVQKLV
ncbi:MAG: four helix bundle protein [Candidatus Omnitrophica bacterium]|nr:four helix bundle protein [Candidatus Omnitrophota bacterium]MBI3083096.1 four helix bundle protein [Candidatus Omnitrophota bacterium]